VSAFRTGRTLREQEPQKGTVQHHVILQAVSSPPLSHILVTRDNFRYAVFSECGPSQHGTKNQIPIRGLIGPYPTFDVEGPSENSFRVADNSGVIDWVESKWQVRPLLDVIPSCGQVIPSFTSVALGQELRSKTPGAGCGEARIVPTRPVGRLGRAKPAQRLRGTAQPSRTTTPKGPARLAVDTAGQKG